MYIITINRYFGASLKNEEMIQYGIAFMIGTSIWSWIIITVYPLYAAISSNSSMNISNKFNNLTLNNCLNTFLRSSYYKFIILATFLVEVRHNINVMLSNVLANIRLGFKISNRCTLETASIRGRNYSS